jgi:voltage-gated potassium channel Kch
MAGFFINLLKLLRAIWHGVRSDQEFRVLLVILVTLLVSSTYFYSSVEGWSVIDALYFSVMTMSTIGYGDLVPTTTLSKLFTIIYSLLSIGVFVAVVTKIVAAILDNKKQSRERREKKKAVRRTPDSDQLDADAQNPRNETDD